MPSSTATITGLYVYPVKGLGPQSLNRVDVETDGVFPGDRAYAIENGPSGFTRETPNYLPKTQFLMLARNESLAALKTAYDPATDELTLERPPGDPICQSLATVEGRKNLENWFIENFAEELRGAPKILSSPGHSFSDVPAKWLSLINLASVRDLEQQIGAPIDPIRFRGNIYVDGIAPWSEFDWVGGRITGGPVLAGMLRTERCAATNVDPHTATRDMNIPKALVRAFGHADCGIYLRVAEPGSLSVGKQLNLQATGLKVELPF